MRKKFLDWEQYQKNMQPEERLTFSRESPFSSITKPPETVFFAWHGSLNLVAKGVNGTFYVCREGVGDSVSLNFDVLSIAVLGDEKRLEMINQKQEYHWIDEIPTFMKKEAPEWVREEVQKIIGFRKEEERTDE